jgi:hypothetical protein
MKLLALLAVATTLSAQTSDVLLKDVRIALPVGPDQVLIIGGEAKGADGDLDYINRDSCIAQFPKSDKSNRLQPGEVIYLVPPDQIDHLRFSPSTNWHIGDQWKVYAGTGRWQRLRSSHSPWSSTAEDLAATRRRAQTSKVRSSPPPAATSPLRARDSAMSPSPALNPGSSIHGGSGTGYLSCAAVRATMRSVSN